MVEDDFKKLFYFYELFKNESLVKQKQTPFLIKSASMPDTYVDVQWWGHGGTEGGLRGSEWLEGKSLPKGISIIQRDSLAAPFLAIMDFLTYHWM